MVKINKDILKRVLTIVTIVSLIVVGMFFYLKNNKSLETFNEGVDILLRDKSFIDGDILKIDLETNILDGARLDIYFGKGLDITNIGEDRKIEVEVKDQKIQEEIKISDLEDRGYYYFNLVFNLKNNSQNKDIIDYYGENGKNLEVMRKENRKIWNKEEFSLESIPVFTNILPYPNEKEALNTNLLKNVKGSSKEEESLEEELIKEVIVSKKDYSKIVFMVYTDKYDEANKSHKELLEELANLIKFRFEFTDIYEGIPDIQFVNEGWNNIKKYPGSNVKMIKEK